MTSSAAPQPPRKKGEGATVTIENRNPFNSMKALWARPKEEVPEQGNAEFYKHAAHAWDDLAEITAMKRRCYLRVP